MSGPIEVAVIGAGPAGLSATLNLVRARRRTLLIDSNRPRNAATFHSHGFITRDGISPVELRKLGRQELDEYPHYEYHQALVSTVEPAEHGFRVVTKGPGLEKNVYLAQTVVIATGLTEIHPDLPTLRAFYGTSIQSCIECYGYTASDQKIALIAGPEAADGTDDLAECAVLLSRYSDDVVVFTNTTGHISESDAHALESRGIRIDSRPVADVAGDRTGLTGVVLESGETVPRTFAFVQPGWDPKLQFAAALGLEVDASGLIVTDGSGGTSVAGVYAAGESSAPGAQQLIVAAGEGARVAARLNRDLLGLPHLS